MDDDRFLKKVTVTGADDSVQHRDIHLLAKEFPYAEFGIVLDPIRHPSEFWLFGLQKLAAQGVRLSGHICGQWARDAFAGGWTIFEQWPWLRHCFSRLQIDTAGVENVENFTWPFRLGEKTFSIKVHESKIQLLQRVREKGILAAGMFKRTPSRDWPESKGLSGYAGGLSHENVATEIHLISKCVADEAWIDANSGLYRNGMFSIGKCAAFLEASRPWVIM